MLERKLLLSFLSNTIFKYMDNFIKTVYFNSFLLFYSQLYYIKINLHFLFNQTHLFAVMAPLKRTELL